MSRRDLVRDYWAAYEASIRPESGSAERNLRHVRRRLGAGEVVAGGRRSSTAPPRRAAAGLVLLGKSASVSVGIGIGALLVIKVAALGWAQIRESPSEPPSEPTAATTEPREPSARPQTGTANVPSVTPAPVPADPAVIPVMPEVERPTDDPDGSTRPRPTLAPADRLRAEVALMDRARAALDRDDMGAVWRMMDDHARRFPRGALTEEREAWRAVAACRLGHADAATRATRFTRSFPRSAQAIKVRRACDGLAVDP